MEHTAYCGLYCENCSIRAKITPAAKALYDEIRAIRFEEIIPLIPNSDGFWPFLTSMAEKGACFGCRSEGGNPACPVRICAREKHIELCALCESYPCAHFERMFQGYPALKEDNAFLRDEGVEAWVNMQNERRAGGFVYR